MSAILDTSITNITLPDRTIVERSPYCDDGKDMMDMMDDGDGYGCAHFNNRDHTASIYMSYSLEDDKPR